MKDLLFSDEKKLPALGSFEFDQRVANVFDDMVSRSVPGYSTIQLLTADLALRFSDFGIVYDIGCSTGATISAIRRRASSGVKIVGVDSSRPMVELCKEKISQLVDENDIKILHGDITTSAPYACGRAGAIIFNLTLQFISPRERTRVLTEAFSALNPGGAAIVVEKTIEEDPSLREMFIDYYHRFKGEMGYSALEIASKREALETVLVPFTRGENIGLLNEAGFASVGTFFQWFNFCGFLAIKEG